MPRTYKEKLGDLRGVKDWQALNSAGDVKRLLRWLILSIRNRTLDPKVAAIMGQLGAFMLKAVETTDLDARLAVIEKALQEPDASDSHPPTTH